MAWDSAMLVALDATKGHQGDLKLPPRPSVLRGEKFRLNMHCLLSFVVPVGIFAGSFLANVAAKKMLKITKRTGEVIENKGSGSAQMEKRTGNRVHFCSFAEFTLSGAEGLRLADADAFSSARPCQSE